MEIKVVCGCGQKFKFDVEPVNGRMPFKVACPSCGADNTGSADLLLEQQFPNRPPPVPVALAAQLVPIPPPIVSSSALRVSVPAPAPAAEAVPVTMTPPPLTTMARTAASKPKKTAGYSLALGVVGAVLGAVLGAGLMFGFFVFAHFRFPFMGTGIGALTGFGARVLGRGTDMSLGVIAGGIALAATAATLYLMYGEAATMMFVSILVSGYFAYRIAG